MQSILFNDNWEFTKGTGNALAALGGGSDVPSERVTVPHDAMIYEERQDNPIGNGTGFYTWESVNYVKNFFMGKEIKDKVVWLEFEGIYENAFIYINNAYAGRCNYGYGNYFIEATKFLKIADINQIKVVVKNGVPSGRWYTGGGIYRDVQMYIGNPLHIACRGARISTPDIENDQAVVWVTIPIEYEGWKLQDVVVETIIQDAWGTVVASAITPVTVFAHERKEIRQQLVVQHPQLWDTEHPTLYVCHTRLKAAGELADEWEDTFGIRKLQLDVKKGLRINGKTVNLRGGCIHHDHGIIGAAVFEHAEERRILKLKEAGFNAIRMAHHPAGKTLLRACDKLGMLVMDEFTDAWTTTKMDFDYGFHFDQSWETDVENMVCKDYNHPSVIMYSIGNEIPETGNKIDSDWGKKITDKIRVMDDTRFTLNCVNLMLSGMGYMDEILEDIGIDDSGSPREINTMMANLGEMMSLVTNHEITTKATEETFAQVDIAGYNYAENRYESDIRRFPNRIIVGSETHPPKLAYNWALVEKYPQIIGDFAWTAWDYLGEAGAGRITYGEDSDGFYGSYPWRAAYSGTINLIGDKRPLAYLREIIWGLRKEPYISVRPPQHYGKTMNPNQWVKNDGVHSWNWTGYEGNPILVEVYADADEVELFINNKCVGRKAAGAAEAFITEFNTFYEPGCIRAVAYKGKESWEQTLVSANNDNSLKLVCSRNIISKKYDISYIEISITDEHGVLNPGSEKEVYMDVSGAGELLALGSANPKSEDNYAKNHCKAFEGRALAVIRANGRDGDIKIEVDADECNIQTIIIKTDI